MSFDVNTVTVEYFKSVFSRDFPYLPQPSEYAQCCECSEETNQQDYVLDTDILRAFEEAKGSFNPSLFLNDSTAKLYFCYVAAHYLVMDLNNAMNSLSMGFNGMVSSKSVGSVSESYAIPQWLMNSPQYAMFAQTGYGRKYLMHIAPVARAAALLITPGRTTNG